MDLTFTAEELAFCNQVRSLVESRLPAELRARLLSGAQPSAEEIRGWQSILHVQGWGAPSWPVAFGGTGWTQVRQYLFERECAMVGARCRPPR